MTIGDVVARLLAIKATHGNLPVLHHDDWDDFFVEAIEVQLPDPPLEDSPPHVLITGTRYGFYGGEKAEPDAS